MSYEPPVTRQPGQPGFQPGAGQHAYSPSGQPGFPPPQGQPAYPPPAPAPQQKFSGLAIAGFILSFFGGALGLILSVVAIFKTGAGKKRGRGLAVAGVVISVIVTGLSIALLANHNSSMALDPGCTSGKDAIFKIAANPTPDQLPTVIAELNTAAGQAKSDEVRAAMQTLADDATKVLNGAKAGKAPDAAQLQKLTVDGVEIDSLCTVAS
jgi:hypothetical protein